MAIEISREDWERFEREDAEIAMAGSLLTWHTRCGQGCRGRTHSEIAWLTVVRADGITPIDDPADDRELAAAIAATLAANFGAEYIAHARAPEAVRNPEHIQQTTAVGIRPMPFGALVDAETDAQLPAALVERQVAYRVTFRSAFRVRDIRRQYLRECPDAAAAIGFADDEGDDDDE